MRESDFERQLSSPMLEVPGAALMAPGTGTTTASAAAGGGRGDHTKHARELEAAFCRDFYCCGLTLLDLHDLLQHYEECHVRFEEDEDCEHSVDGSGGGGDSEFLDEDSWSDSESLSSSSGSSSSPLGSGSSDSLSMSSRSTGQHHRHHRHQPHFQQCPNGPAIPTNKDGHASVSASWFMPPLPSRQGGGGNGGGGDGRTHHHLHADNINPTTHALEVFSTSLVGVPKRKTVVSLSDIYVENEGGYEYDDGDPSSAFLNTILYRNQNSTSYGSSNSNNNKSTDVHSSGFAEGLTAGAAGAYNRGHAQGIHYSIRPNVFLGGSVPTTSSGSSASGLSLLTSSSQSPYIVAAVDLMRQRDEVFSIIEDMTKIPASASSENKPYRCSVMGCDKAYKNPNGLKYHNLHGHCSNSLGDGDSPESKPYVCTFLECGKRYKNLNGLKYHIEHTHPNLIAALRAHQSGLANHPLIVNGPFANGSAVVMTIAAALAAVGASPMMALAANAILTAQTAAANQANAAAAAAAAPTSESAASSSGQLSHGGNKFVSDSEPTVPLEGGFVSTTRSGLPQVVMAISGSLESGSHHSMVPIAPAPQDKRTP
ncbi:hypothetical protein KI688_009833 [Linnemannia hyalina]|uniref:C2H2-type domain-containing protein n=1 Tax=Linnemannia hyalina TaxID=64524 RepID=A0A9P7XYF0_9FUNG|nr:hypothetical protein KI688_009833 [Linnemannia hyalina]